MRNLFPFLRDAWALARPFWRSEERWKARGLLSVVVALNLALVGMGVVLTFWQRAFYNALEAKDFSAFTGLILWGHHGEEGFMPGFSIVAALYIMVAVYAAYLRQALDIRWRRWVTEHMLADWLRDRAYYRIGLSAGKEGADNPDQRIAEDSKLFVSSALVLGLSLMNAVVTLFSYVALLWSLSGPMQVFGVSIPGYMVWVAVLYAAMGSWVSHIIGRRLIRLNFLQERVEADFRYALVRVRENMEGIALHGGEPQERQGLLGRFGAVIDNWWGIMRVTKQLSFFSTGYGQVAIIFPFVAAAPAYFSGAMPLGGLIQTSSAFGEVQGALSWFVTYYPDLTNWRASVDRLTGFQHALEDARAKAGQGPARAPASGALLSAEALDISLPDGRALTHGAALALAPGEAVLITGRSGSGKSTLFRALAGIWPFGQGRIAFPEGSSLFLPQRPYLPLGTLRQAVCYPATPDSFSDEAIRQALDLAGLGALAEKLDVAESWDRRLSGGEQQRLALARALLLKPRWLFLDEATASLDPESEEKLYATLRRELPGTAILSIAHRPAVAQHHDRVLRLEGGSLIPQATPV
ncbi:ABC transporter ATP-binding protein/permease [Roseomonas sp. 18066]|uniref:ABC transporter ATP-binding protein/permease n=1 Tax=Roseomonas sp. 18066 TaxID=2681412 RepID=UPI00135B0AF9|nr:ABC transporter ATP-binding protein/permease [Roseomonas sp. 18066]